MSNLHNRFANTSPNCLLASSSVYRGSLLAKLGLKFIQKSPNIDESKKPKESAKQLASRLSRDKATVFCNRYPQHIIIASDQVAQSSNKLQDNQILGKPGTREVAIEQLTSCSGHSVMFNTGLCVLSPFVPQIENKQLNKIEIEGSFWHMQLIVEQFEVTFKTLSQRQIINYVDKEKPLDCAGSFKSEGLGISLFEKMQGDDPNSLIGLPLIKLCNMLNNIQIDVLDL